MIILGQASNETADTHPQRFRLGGCERGKSQIANKESRIAPSAIRIPGGSGKPTSNKTA
jgi:hypothetical protein